MQVKRVKGSKINKDEMKKPSKYPKIKFSLEIDFDKINSISLFSKERVILIQTNKIIPNDKMVLTVAKTKTNED